MKIIKFEKQNCGPCTMVSNYLNEEGVEYTALNPFDGGEAADLAGKYQIGFQVPVTILVDAEGNEVARSRGYNPEELDELILGLNPINA